jgi:hypothetical protein
MHAHGSCAAVPSGGVSHSGNALAMRWSGLGSKVKLLSGSCSGGSSSGSGFHFLLLLRRLSCAAGLGWGHIGRGLLSLCRCGEVTSESQREGEDTGEGEKHKRCNGFL